MNFVHERLVSQWAWNDAEASTTNIENSINDCKVKLTDDYNICLTFNVKDLRLYHGEDLRARLFSQLWGIDVGASTTYIENSILILEISYSGGYETLETPNMF